MGTGEIDTVVRRPFPVLPLSPEQWHSPIHGFFFKRKVSTLTIVNNELTPSYASLPSEDLLEDSSVIHGSDLNVQV